MTAIIIIILALVALKVAGDRATARQKAGKPAVQHSKNATAALLAILLGPVGLFYKGKFGAGIAWLVMTILFMFVAGPLVAPLFWLGMIVHAYSA
jgi:hypothetical protein